MSLNVSRTEILDVDKFTSASALIILIREIYSRIIAEYLYGLTIKLTILRALSKCFNHHACVVNSYHTIILAHGRPSNCRLLTASLRYSLLAIRKYILMKTFYYLHIQQNLNLNNQPPPNGKC
jgi:hypothetical protein